MTKSLEDSELARRTFLAKCGKYALITPPVVTLMLSASGRNNYALALSGSSTSHGGGFGGSASSGGGGSGSIDPGILQSRGGSGSSELSNNAELACSTSRIRPTSWRTACARPDRPNFDIDSSSPSAG
jgi:hypothetical protein